MIFEIFVGILITLGILFIEYIVMRILDKYNFIN